MSKMTTGIDRRDRTFQVWSYTVSMGRLLLRSTKNNEFETRVDVVFQNVQALQLPTLLPGLLVEEAGPLQISRISTETGFSSDADRIFFLLKGSGFAGYVVASVMDTCEDSGEYYEPSRVWPDGPGRLS